MRDKGDGTSEGCGVGEEIRGVAAPSPRPPARPIVKVAAWLWEGGQGRKCASLA